MNLLMLAAKSGCDNCINIFCNSSQIDINEKYENKTALLMAVDAHHIEFANIVVGCNPNIYINKNLAHIEKMLNLLGHGSAYEYINNALNQYIRSAILEGKVDVINEYIRVFGHDESYFVREIRLRKYDEDEHPISLLFFAVWHGQTACAIALANVKKIDLNAKFEGETSLIVATRQGHIEIVKDLLSRDETDVNERDFFGWTAFIHVAKQNNLEMTRLFLKDGRVHLTLRTYKGRDAFFYAHRHASCRNTEPVLDDAAHLIMEACL